MPLPSRVPPRWCWKPRRRNTGDRKSTRLNSSHTVISYAVFCLKKKTLNNESLQMMNDLMFNFNYLLTHTAINISERVYCDGKMTYNVIALLVAMFAGVLCRRAV